MARRGLTGQLNMFDFFSSLETGEPGEVEMVSLVPNFEEEPEPVLEVEPEPVVEEVPETEEVPVVKEMPETIEEQVLREDANVAMSRSYELDGVKMEIAYINYNKVRITRGDETPIIKEFATTKEAVDYYVEQMQELEADE